ncbi:MAG: DUF1501 domain-containing protein [Pirellulales bacterium]|nr:DUF1501 domain-containing protein [Pirellulales bacterium]
MKSQSKNNDLSARRKFFYRVGQGLGGMALSTLMGQGNLQAAPTGPRVVHFPPRAKNVIYLFMVGGPSNLDMYDYKPALARYEGQPLPTSLQRFQKFAQIKEKQPKILPTPWKFTQCGETGRYVSELIPHFRSIVDEVAMVQTVKTEETVHPFAEMLFNTGYREYGKPSIGAWVTYGLGSESQEFPAYIVLQSGSRLRAKGANFTNGFLPPTYQGVPFRDAADPVLNLSTPAGISEAHQRDVVHTIGQLNKIRDQQMGDPQIAARTSAYELAFRMQHATPELMSLTDESATTLSRYGADPTQPSFARNCLLARRLVERGVRFVQLFHGDWDHHANLAGSLPGICRQIDQGCAALILDLKERGLLDETLVIFAGEFGRTSVAQKQQSGQIGRDHHIEAFPVWLAGGGVRPGYTLGQTDELGVYATQDPVHVHDLHATILHLLGLDHKQLTYRFQGRDFRLTDVYGNVMKKLLA